MDKSFVLRGNICYSKNMRELHTVPRGYLVCENGRSAGVFRELPGAFKHLPLEDFGERIIIPGLIDLHIHAPQFSYRGLGMDLELLNWLDTYTFPEEAKYKNIEYARRAYADFVEDVKKGPNTRAVVFATVHVLATELLMDMLEASGLVTMVGKVNMDRNASPDLQEESAEASARATSEWLADIAGKYKNTYPIITPRFIPSCTDELMRALKTIQAEHGLPIQSHLSENKNEIEWVKELCPGSASYGDAYDRFGLFGGSAKTIMAHCVWSDEDESDLIEERGVFVAHCPQSNTNICSGIAPIRRYIEKGLRVGLGSDVAGGSDTSLFKIMRSAIEVSKLRWRLVDRCDTPLTVGEAFFLGTMGGGEFFGKAGSFDEGYEFDAVVLDDTNLKSPLELSLKDRVARIVMYADDRNIDAKFVRGTKIL
ncbi:amidohydrolase family protein [Synergistaceae bacterium OttesenSCG-928-D05]|nr:amidohydrolase family protein [Synergistaceae bacterium OttesenSCG-928-D05]